MAGWKECRFLKTMLTGRVFQLARMTLLLLGRPGGGCILSGKNIFISTSIVLLKRNETIWLHLKLFLSKKIQTAIALCQRPHPGLPCLLCSIVVILFYNCLSSY